jgi:glycopeptide antibiotics resistance protein
VQGLTSITQAVFWFALLSPVVALVTLAISRRRARRRPPADARVSMVLDVAMALAVLGVATVTLLPVDPYHTGLGWGVQLRPLASIIEVVTRSVDASVMVRIVVLNIVLFIPLGFVLGLRTGRWITAVGIAFAVSVAVETLQALLPLGRTANVDDVILNTLGGAVGAGVALMVLRALRGRERAVPLAGAPQS